MISLLPPKLPPKLHTHNFSPSLPFHPLSLQCGLDEVQVLIEPLPEGEVPSSKLVLQIIMRVTKIKLRSEMHYRTWSSVWKKTREEKKSDFVVQLHAIVCHNLNPNSIILNKLYPTLPQHNHILSSSSQIQPYPHTKPYPKL